MKKYFIKKSIAYGTLLILVAPFLYSALEPVIVDAITVTDNVTVTLNVTSGVTISSPADVTMAPNMGAGVNSSIGGADWTVTTNSATGYTLGVQASSAPALVSGGNSFADYTTTPTLWATGLGAGTYKFAYAPRGTNVNTTTWGTGADCGTAGAPNATLKYSGFTTSSVNIATKATPTGTSGDTTTVCFAAGQNGVFAPSGTYTATITATAIAS